MFATLLEKVSLGTPRVHHNLTLTPILLSDGSLSSLEPLSLGEALAAGTLEVSEVSARGSVPELRVKSSSKVPVLILDGEELIGAKQNRIVNVSILVPPQGEVIIPVSCIEAGRWSYTRSGFAAADRVLSQGLRYSKADSVTRSLKEGHMRYSDQHAVWAGVGQMLDTLATVSPTQALSDSYESRADAIDAYVAAFPLQACQVGVIYRIDGVVAGADLFGSERAFARAFPKLVRGSALQSLAGYKQERTANLKEQQFLRRMLAAPTDSFPAVGMGEELRIDTDDIGGGALYLNTDLVHLFAYARPSVHKEAA